MFKLLDVLFAFVIVALLILVGRWIKQRIGLLQRLYLPESIIAGVLALLFGPQVLGAIVTALGGENSFFAENGIFSEPMRIIWSESPGVFINIVFAALFLGETIPQPREIWRKAAPQVAFGQTLAWGQYVVGLLTTLLVLVPIFKVSPMAGALIEIGFEGGHGTAGGMQETFQELGFPDGGELAVGLATVGIVSGVVVGTLLANWGRRKGYVAADLESETPQDLEHMAQSESRQVREARQRLTQGLLIDPLSLNFGFVGIAIAIGWLILEGLRLIETLTWGNTGFQVLKFVPLFPIALVGGVIVQLVMERLELAPLIIRPLQERISGVALDIVVVTAIANISLQVLGANLGVFVILSVVGIAWNVFAFLYLAPRILTDYWFERGIGDLGQSMGVTATGILLLRMVDPDNRTGAFESFAYKQLFFEPIVGGGLFTAAAPALIVQLGAVSVLGITTVLLIFFMGFGFYNYKKFANG
ncbi:MAG: sodium/glutamate symporter [Spirulinaceae cyanobacterium]